MRLFHNIWLTPVIIAIVGLNFYGIARNPEDIN
jgi:hypothetical protein